MYIRTISEVKVRGKSSGLFNYAYFAEDGQQISGTFQGTADSIAVKEAELFEQRKTEQ